MSKKYLYYHNPRCSKSREGLTLLLEKKINFTVKEYLKEGLDEKELVNLFDKLDALPIRTKETCYKELALKDQNLSPCQWAKILVKNPILLERPILVSEQKAIIGRPPENLLTIT